MAEIIEPMENTAAQPISMETQQMVKLIYDMLTARQEPVDSEIPPALQQDETFKCLMKNLTDLRDLSASLSRGDLQNSVISKGFVLSNLKTLQSSLRHLTWQTIMVANGDFSQKVDFLGDFSTSFNEMTHKLQGYRDQMRHLATYDALTQVPNRLSLESFGEEAFLKARKNGKPLTILMLDIDHFKNVNDTYGHTIGDIVLVKLCELLNSQLRGSDFVARYGGEEFVVILPSTTIGVANQIAERILQVVQEMVIAVDDDTAFCITVSIGLSELNANDTRYTDIVERSDEAMYCAKIAGRNRVCKG